MSKELEQAAKQIAYDVCKDLPQGEQRDSIVYYSILAAIKGAEWMKQQVLEYLDKWMEHSIRGSEKGNHIYYLGKIALIMDIQDWLKKEDGK